VADQDRVVGRVLATESKGNDGAVRRETIEYGQGLYDQISRLNTSDLQPRRKIVEWIVPKPDGASSFVREVFRLDVNGEWKPVPYNWVGDRP
jgi:hypothetical protein